MNGSSPHAYRFEDGLLLADLRDGTVTITGWPAPKAEWQLKNGRAEACRPDFRFVYPAGQEPSPALAEFRSSLPPEIAAVLEPFTTLQWNLLELLAARPEAMQLASHNPVLAYLLANNDHFRKNLTKPPAYLAQWRLDYKQQQLLEWLGFPNTTAMVKLMRKIVPGAVTPDEARLLRNALVANKEAGEMLAHLSTINRAVVGLVVNARLLPYLSPNLLLEASQLDSMLPSEQEPGNRILAAITAAMQMGYRVKLQPLKSVLSISQIDDRLKKHHEDWLQDQRDQKVKRPIPEGNENIIRLLTRYEVQREGREQDNCVGSKASAVVQEVAYVYRVLHPERATLEIRRRGDCGRWEIAEIKKYKNEAVDKKTEAYIRAWLQQRDAEFLVEYRKKLRDSATKAALKKLRPKIGTEES